MTSGIGKDYSFRGYKPFVTKPVDFSNINVMGHTIGDGGKIAAAWESVRSNSWDPSKIEITGMNERAKLKGLGIESEADIYATELLTEAQLKALKETTDAQKSAYKAQQQSSGIGSALGAVASIAGAFIGSDESIKHDINKIEDALSVLRELKPVTFYYNEEYSSSPERLHHGFIAQDYQKVMPDATYRDESTGKLCIDTHELIALLVRANQQLEARVTRLEAANVLQRVPQGVK